MAIEVETAELSRQRAWNLRRGRVSATGLEPCPGLTSSGLYRVDLTSVDCGEVQDEQSYLIAHDGDVRIGSHRDGLTGPSWDGVEVTEVSVAVLAAENPNVPVPDRRFHVFLPTTELTACSILVNGAFTTDLSRQHIRVSDSDRDYNGFLIRMAARTFVSSLMPHLVHERGPVHVLGVLRRDEDTSGDAARLLHVALADALRDVPLLPAGDEVLTFSEAVMPAHILGERGHEFASLLKSDAEVEGSRFPDPRYCKGDLAVVAKAYGSRTLTPAESMIALAVDVDPVRATLRAEPKGRFYIDPVLAICQVLWENADSDDRGELEVRARSAAIFPVGQQGDGSVNRIALGEETAFYPPRAAIGALSLERLRFLAHAISWGSLAPSEQRRVLERPMRAWDALFGMKEFRFEEVMRAAVLPALTRSTPPDEELLRAVRSVSTLAAICRLSGKTVKPDRPLRLGRLGAGPDAVQYESD